MTRLAAVGGSRCSPVCSLQQRQRSDQHKSQQRGGPAAASRWPSLGPSLQRELLGAPTTAPEQQQDAQIGLQALPLAPAALAAAGFAAVANDVFSPSSLHVLLPLDQWAHAAVSGAHWDPALQRLLAGKLVSDAGIVAGLAGWVAVAAAALLPTQPASPRLLRALGISTAAYLLAGGSIKHGDTPLVAAMKEGWHRARPSDVLHTFAFPSGHTTAATFICGTLLFVLLPAALDALSQDMQPSIERQQGKQQQQVPSQLGSAARQAASWVLERRWALWAGAVALTGAGRVAADAHWCSDVMAGALLGVALTGLTAQLCSSVESSVLLLNPQQLGGQRRSKRK